MPEDIRLRVTQDTDRRSSGERPPGLRRQLFAALMLLVAAGWGCDRILGRLSREKVKELVEGHTDFSPVVGVYLRQPTEAAVTGGILEGLWKLRGEWPEPRLVLKPRGLKVFRSIRPAGEGALIGELQVPVKRRVVSITGVKDVGKIRKEAEFTWALDEGLPPMVARLTVVAFGSAPQQGRAAFEKFDDGWRLVKLETDLPKLAPFTLEMVDQAAFAEATREGVAEMSAQAVGTWSGGAFGGPVTLRLAPEAGGKLGGVLQYACASTRLSLGDGSDPDALVLDQQVLDEGCDSLRGLHIHMQMQSQVALSFDEGKATLRWRQRQGGTMAVVGTAELVKTAATAALPAAPATAPATTGTSPGPGVYLLTMRPRCCVVAGWQQELVTALSARGTAAFPGAVLDGKIVRKSGFESRLDDVVIGPVATQDLDRFVGGLPAVVGPLAEKLGDGANPPVQGDPRQIFQIGMYQFQVIRP